MDLPPHRPLAASSLAVLHPNEPQKPLRWRYGQDDPSHVKIEVHLEGTQTDIPEGHVLFEYTDQLEVVKYIFDSRNFHEVGTYNAKSNVQNQPNVEGSLKYRVTSCNLDQSFLGESSSSGYLDIQSILFTFADLVGVYVRMKLFKVKQIYNASSVKKPAEKAYIKALAKAAREAPGNASSFRGMEGWNDVYG